MPVAPQADSGSSMRIACHILALLWELGNLQQITWLIGYFTQLYHNNKHGFSGLVYNMLQEHQNSKLGSAYPGGH